MDLEVIYKGKKWMEYHFDLCNITKGGCPIKPGTSVIVVSIKTPSYAFPGTYTVSSSVRLTENFRLLAKGMI